MSGTQLTGGVVVVSQGLFDITQSTAQENLGELVHTNDGRAFRYGLAGAVALVPGKLYQAAAQITADQNLTAVAAAIGATTLVSTTTVTQTANLYANGYAIITVTPGQGYQYKISSHAAYTSAAPTYNLSDAIQVALTTASRIDLMQNPYSAVIVSPTTASSAFVGVAVAAIPATYYGWLQVGGVANVLADGAVTTGNTLVASAAVAGAVKTTTGATSVIGISMSGIADTEYGSVKLFMI